MLVIHPTALIGEPPEDRRWQPGDQAWQPEIAPDAQIGALTKIDAGRTRPTRVGARSWVLSRTYIGHDAIVGDDCETSPGTVICGHAIIGDHVKIGANATILPYVEIGDNARIGAGAVVNRDVPSGETWAGNPARPIRAAVTA